MFCKNWNLRNFLTPEAHTVNVDSFDHFLHTWILNGEMENNKRPNIYFTQRNRLWQFFSDYY